MIISRITKAMEYIDDDLVSGAATYKKSKKKAGWIQWGAVAACLCLVVFAAAAFPKYIHEQGAGKPAPSGGPQPAGDNGEAMYSVAIFPADRTTDEVKNAYTEKIYEVEAQNEPGLGEYLPTELPNGHHFGNASIYVTTMNDGTVYKMLRITYRTGENPEPVTDADGAQAVSNPSDLGDEFRLSVWGFKPNTSAEIYQPEELNEATLSGQDGSLFYVQFEDVYIGIEPLSLSVEEIIGLVRSIMR